MSFKMRRYFELLLQNKLIPAKMVVTIAEMAVVSAEMRQQQEMVHRSNSDCQALLSPSYNSPTVVRVHSTYNINNTHRNSDWGPAATWRNNCEVR